MKRERGRLMAFIPRPREIYKHFKGDLYQVVEIAEHTETGEQLVIYQALYGGMKIYARPLAMFTERVDREKYPDAAQEFRFELQGPEAERQRRETAAGQAASGRQSAAVAADNAPAAATAAVQVPAAVAETVSVAVAADNAPASGEEPALDPLVLEFLDTKGYEQRLNILAGLHHRITDDMITTMAIACDVEISEGDTEERYEALRSCLLTLEKYECNRLR